jgi:undecaprenyl-diphosphatase
VDGVIATLSYLQAVVMGLLQGVTELFPVSSLGHSVLVPALLGWNNLVSSQSQAQSFFLTFLVALHVGTAVGLIVYYRQTWWRLLSGTWQQLVRARSDGWGRLVHLDDEGLAPEYRLFALLVLATIPVGLAGLLLEKPLRELFAKPLAAAIFLTLNGVILFAAETLKRRRGRRTRSVRLGNLSPRQAITIGFAQVFALLAGISRAGITMAAGLARGLDHEDAANFSFLLATPVILLAGLYKLPGLLGHLGNGVRTQAFVGAIVAMISAYLAVSFLTKWFRSHNLRPFATYSVVVGLVLVVRFF